ncbi:MAG: hypothetical protein EBT45_03240 [Alphaproteobacteria bacterium]|nr:hypothetical protein [Alphaproteobacteria bacterium]
MPISEIPSKFLERAEALTEAKLNVAANLTAIKCSLAKEEWDEEKILKTYLKFYHGIKEISPPPLEKLSQKKINIYLVGGTIVVALLLSTLVFFKYSDFLLK